MRKFNLYTLINDSKKNMLSLLFVMFSLTFFAQTSFYENIDLFYNKIDEHISKSQYNDAIKTIDTLCNKNAFIRCNQKAYLKGYVYESKYSKTKNNQDYDSCFHYFSQALSCTNDFNSEVKKQMNYLANVNHNKAADALNAEKIDSAEFYYSQSRKALLLVDSSTVYKRDIDFYLAIASTCLRIYEKEREGNKVYFEKSVDYYKKVLSIDSTNYSATYGTMIAYYNMAVLELKKADYCKQVEIANAVDWTNPKQEIPSIEKLLECVKPEEFEKYNFTPIIKKALPFALKAYKLNPSNKHTLQALIGIYFSLNDAKALSKYKKELKKLG